MKTAHATMYTGSVGTVSKTVSTWELQPGSLVVLSVWSTHCSEFSNTGYTVSDYKYSLMHD